MNNSLNLLIYVYKVPIKFNFYNNLQIVNFLLTSIKLMVSANILSSCVCMLFVLIFNTDAKLTDTDDLNIDFMYFILEKVYSHK